MSTTELPAFDKRDLLIIVAFSVACGCLKELLAYVFVYRRPGFKKKFEEVQERFEEYHRTYVLFEPRTANYNCFQDVNKRLLDASK
uniref:Uncharacterized protein n=1 Tax=Babesia bovis TaxID=5865 RepID=A7AVH9_BABBO|eukprot:XP_001609373.1 hypothetical protein [Babesia bovis T2Bo]